MQETGRLKVQKQLKMEVYEPADIMKCAAPIICAPRDDGSQHFCVEIRKLNAVSVRDFYQFPRMDECIDSLEESQVFTTLGANSG